MPSELLIHNEDFFIQLSFGTQDKNHPALSKGVLFDKSQFAKK